MSIDWILWWAFKQLLKVAFAALVLVVLVFVLTGSVARADDYLAMVCDWFADKLEHRFETIKKLLRWTRKTN